MTNSIDLANIETRSFVIWCAVVNDRSGYSVTPLRNINNEGFGDTLLARMQNSCISFLIDIFNK